MNPALAFAAIAAVWTLGAMALGAGEAFVYLAPALLILLPLMSGRYPGDEALSRPALRRRGMSPLGGSAAIEPDRRTRPAALLPRGGRLVGAALAGRAPPPWAAG